MITLKSFDELTESETHQFISFLQDSYKETSNPASVNMWDPAWESRENTLPYKLFKDRTFDNPNGILFVAFDSNTIVGVSGAYISTFCNQMLIAGVRTWIHKAYRNMQLPREYFLPAQKQWAIDNKLKVIALTFNEYNSNLIQAFKRKRLGENRTKREPHHMFYNGVIEVPFAVNIQHTRQYVIYERLADYDFDWESIRHIDN